MALLERRGDADPGALGPHDRLATAPAERAARSKRMGFHYAWVVSAVTFLTLLVAAGVRTAPGVFIKPFEDEFGWNRASISLAVAVSLLAYGLGGPLGGSLVDRFGPRKVMLGGLVLIALGLGPMLAPHSPWQLYLLWAPTTGPATVPV